MIQRPITLPLSISLAGAVLLLVLARVASASLAVQESGLNPTGTAFEINPDGQGSVWISDYGAGEIRHFDPSDDSYTVYPVGGGPSDARSDDAGSLWWADFAVNQVGRLSIADGSTSLWEVPGSSSLFGTGLGTNGDIWVTDSLAPYLYHLSPLSSQVCTYTLPLDGSSDYLLVDEGQIWLGDWQNSQIDRLDVAGDTFTWWGLLAGSRPAGMALDSSGDLWWTDTVRGVLARLTPGSNQVITYTQSVVQNPQMLALDGGKVWYSDQEKVGVLDPARAAGHSSTLIPQSEAVTKTCSTLEAPITTIITPTTGEASWSDVTYPQVYSQNGWQVFQLPEGGTAWGIAAVESIWLIDQGRQVLAKLPKQTEIRVYLPVVMR